jgi:voltage-gated potassium channel Kch
MASVPDTQGESLSAKVLVLGEPGALGEALVRRLSAAGVAAQLTNPPTDADVKAVLEQDGWTAAAIITRDDALALRLTLLCEHVHPELPLWATVFDRTIVHQLRAAVPAVRLLSPSEMAAGELADACLTQGVRPRPRWSAGLRLVDAALRLLVGAGLGLAAALIVQIVISLIALHEGFVDALFFSARALATIADSPAAGRASAWFKIVSTADVFIAVGLLAVFTAALVRILSRLRLTTVLGPRSAPGHGHVIVVGFGQVGFRLTQMLRDRGVPVLALEAAEHAPAVRLAPRAGLPLAIGRGDDRTTLELLGVRRCAAVAAVTSDDLTNVAIGLAVNDLAPGTPLVLRLGDGDVAAETDSLLHLGTICDVHDVVAGEIAREILASGEAITPPTRENRTTDTRP